jgi:hypothetical protein
VEREHEMERLAAVLRNRRAEAENSQRVSLNPVRPQTCQEHSAATENWRFT